MKWLPRLLMILGLAGFLSLFAFPLWRITLVAPQYPTGVRMYIWINKIGGETAGTSHLERPDAAICGSVVGATVAVRDW